MKTLTFGKKISLGFAGVVAITVAIGLFSVYTAKSGLMHSYRLSEEFVPEARVATELNEAVFRMQGEIHSYDLTGDERYLKEGRASSAEAKRLLEEARRLAAAHPLLKRLGESIAAIEPDLSRFQDSIEECVRLVGTIGTCRDALGLAAEDCIKNLQVIEGRFHRQLDEAWSAGKSAEDVATIHENLKLTLSIFKEEEEARLFAYKAQVLRDDSLMVAALEHFEEIAKNVEMLGRRLSDDASLEEIDHVRKDVEMYQQRLSELRTAQHELKAFAKRQEGWADELERLSADLAKVGMDRAVAEAEASSEELRVAAIVSWWGLGLAFVAATVLGWYISSSTNQRLTGIAQRLGFGSRQLDEAAGVISDASTLLAEVSNRQASAVEETSASLEQIASVTRSNASQSEEVKEKSDLTREIVDRGVSNMKRLSEAMVKMKESNGHVSKIISSIDEIAFQTNILALNAAVEAARAGESGAGFSVVAEEVRALAQRSALAASETTESLEESLKISKKAETISVDLGESFEAIAAHVMEIDTMVDQISHASKEQAQGVDQINTAVSEIDQATQENAAASEECSSNAGQLRDQASDLDEIVQELESLCGVRRGRQEKSRKAAIRRAPAQAPRSRVEAEADLFFSN